MRSAHGRHQSLLGVVVGIVAAQERWACSVTVFGSINVDVILRLNRLPGRGDTVLGEYLQPPCRVAREPTRRLRASRWGGDACNHTRRPDRSGFDCCGRFGRKQYHRPFGGSPKSAPATPTGHWPKWSPASAAAIGGNTGGKYESRVASCAGERRYFCLQHRALHGRCSGLGAECRSF